MRFNPANDHHDGHLTRRAVMGYGGAIAAGIVGARLPRAAAAQDIASPVADDGAAIVEIARQAMTEMDLRAVLLHVTVDDEELLTHALGESLTGVPASADMHVRNGAVAITYMATALLTLVDDGTLALDDTIDRWLPDLPDAGQVTLKMLANMTAGYPDYVPNPNFSAAFYRDPWRAWTADDLVGFGLAQPRLFAPGENWGYSHTNYTILGLALEAATGRPLADLLRDRILDPIGLPGTASEQTAWMPEPVLHACSSERRAFLGIAPGTSFLEESTFWNPSWTLPPGAVQYSTIADMTASFAAIGRGDLLSGAAMDELLSKELLGFGAPLAGCPSCRTMDEIYLYGLGVVQSGGWMVQNPLFGGYASAVMYHPGAGIAIAVATTFTEAGFADDGAYRFGKSGQAIATRIGALLLPDDPPLMR